MKVSVVEAANKAEERFTNYANKTHIPHTHTYPVTVHRIHIKLPHGDR